MKKLLMVVLLLLLSGCSNEELIESVQTSGGHLVEIYEVSERDYDFVSESYVESYDMELMKGGRAVADYIVSHTVTFMPDHIFYKIVVDGAVYYNEQVFETHLTAEEYNELPLGIIIVTEEHSFQYFDVDIRLATFNQNGSEYVFMKTVNYDPNIIPVESLREIFIEETSTVYVFESNLKVTKDGEEYSLVDAIRELDVTNETYISKGIFLEIYTI